MFEVEVKARIHSSYQDLLVRLQKLGADQEKAVNQVDTLYLPQGLTYGDIVWGMPVIRIRDQDGTVFFCVKQKPNSELIAIEHETVVQNGDELRKIIETLNFTPVLVVKKKRQVYKLGQLSICADEVESLGVFIEVEQLVTDESQTTQVLAGLWQFLQQLGVSDADRVTNGYDSLIYKLQQEESGI